jgi:hypothetical protein
MKPELELEVMYADLSLKAPAILKGRDLTDQLDKLKKALEYMLNKMQKLGGYELSEFTATAGVELGAWILTAKGSVEMKWEKPKKE